MVLGALYGDQINADEAEREFGIYKALGYTDRQLMEQIAISFLPASIGGTFAGSAAACLSVNRMAGSFV